MSCDKVNISCTIIASSFGVNLNNHTQVAKEYNTLYKRRYASQGSDPKEMGWRKGEGNEATASQQIERKLKASAHIVS